MKKIKVVYTDLYEVDLLDRGSLIEENVNAIINEMQNKKWELDDIKFTDFESSNVSYLIFKKGK